MPWGILSYNVNFGKTRWSTILLSIAPDCTCYNVLYDRGVLWWNDLSPMKIGINPLGSWIQGSRRISRNLGIFSRNFGAVKYRMKPDMKGGYISLKLQQKWMMIPYFVRIWNQMEGWLGSWHMSCSLVTWPDPAEFFLQKLCKTCPISYAKFQRDPSSGSASISEKLMTGCINPPCTAER